MKKHSKILAVVMALAILCSIAVVPVSAGELDTKTYIKYRFVDADGNTITSAEKGDLVDLIASVNTNVYGFNFQGAFKYDSNALVMVKNNVTAAQIEADPGITTNKTIATNNNCAAWLGDFKTSVTEIPLTEEDGELYTIDQDNNCNEYYHNYATGATKLTTVHNDGLYPASWSAAQKAQYKVSTFVFNSNATGPSLLVNTKGQDLDMIRFRFLVKQDTTLSSATVGYDEGLATKNFISYDSSNLPFGDIATEGLVRTDLTVVGATLSIAGNDAPAVTVENITTQVQWENKDAGKMRVAFRGNIKNYDLNLVDGSQTEIADISEMGVVYSKTNTDPTVGGANCTDVDAWTIYDFTSGGYFFRAVVGNYGYDDTTTLYAKAYIVIDGQTIYAPSAMTTTGAQAYTAGLANGMSAK